MIPERGLRHSTFALGAPKDPDQDGAESGPSARTFMNGRDVAYADGRLFVADSDTDRALIFEARGR